MRTFEATGRSIDEAIFNGLRELEISIDEVEIDIIQQESKGILGIGARPAIVRLIEREPEEVVIPEYIANPQVSERPRRDRFERDDRRGPRRTDRPERGGRPERPAHFERSDRPERAPRVDYTSDPNAPRVIPEGFTAEAAEGNAAAVFLKGLIERMGVEGAVLANISDDAAKLYIDTSTMGMLIGHRGETLDAMQYLTSLAANRNRKEDGYTRITIDTEGYREKREETLTRLARKIAGQVKATGRARTLEPMNPYERRVLHATLQNSPYVSTRSEGEEPNRRVVIFPRPRDKRDD